MSSKIVLPCFSGDSRDVWMLKWLALDGSEVMEGQPILELECKGVVREMESPSSGTLLIMVPDGEKCSADQELAEIINLQWIGLLS